MLRCWRLLIDSTVFIGLGRDSCCGHGKLLDALIERKFEDTGGIDSENDHME